MTKLTTLVSAAALATALIAGGAFAQAPAKTDDHMASGAMTSGDHMTKGKTDGAMSSGEHMSTGAMSNDHMAKGKKSMKKAKPSSAMSTDAMKH